MPSKIRCTFSIIIILTVCACSLWLGHELSTEYFNYGDSIHFLWLSASTYLAPGIFSFPLMLFVLTIIKGQEKAEGLCLKYMYIYKYILIISLVILFSFPFVYVNILYSKGYVACKGIPSGYMPGVGKQYVTDLSLCK